MIPFLTGLGWPALLAGSAAFFGLVALATRVILVRVVPEEMKDHCVAVAGPLMPALGALFAIAAAFTISTEWNALREAQDQVAREAASAARLAWASTTPGVDGQQTRALTADYLQATVDQEWSDISTTSGERGGQAFAALTRLQQHVRRQVADGTLPAPVATESLAGLDDLTTARRIRVASASHEIPPVLLYLLVVSGVALIVDAEVLTLRHRRGLGFMATGLVVVTAMTVALILAISAPFHGELRASHAPLDQMIDDLHGGRFGP